MSMAYKGIRGRDTGMSMPIGITCFAVAAGCSAAGIGRPSAGIGRVIFGEIGRSLGRRGLAYCMQAAGYKFEPLDPDCEKLMDTGNPSCWLGAIEDPCGGRQATIEPQASKCKAANLLLFQLERVCAV
jgi:hypothetical protein